MNTTGTSGIVATGEVSLVRIRRGVSDPQRSALFYAWLLGVAAERGADGYRLPCANGDLLVHGDASVPVAMELATTGASFEGRDPDGVPIAVAPQALSQPAKGVLTLDHVRLNCADLAAATAIYRRVGFVLTWDGGGPAGETLTDGYHETLVPGADWVHLSGADGYLSLSQADWQDYGTHSTASGPPRFVHIGLAVTDLAGIAARLEEAGIPHSVSPRDSIGDRIYLNDPDGDARLGNNIELIQYEAGVSRSGRYVRP